ncbi:glycosyl hydrolase family 65 protein [Allomuricauda sp. d1]|uniref:glycoside hydrolase family 65 protein n=1 Tax=Allomuricauda sp. d1 TaxID=3136725 RepID=UPI0031DCB2EB
MDLKNNLRTETGWKIIEKSFNPEQLVTTGSNFMIGNGYMGYRGTFEEWTAKEYTACIVTDTWDKAEGSKWSELCNVPNGLFTQLFIDDERLSVFSGQTAAYYRALDMKNGLNQRQMRWTSPKGKKVHLNVEKFASLDNHHQLVLNYSFKALQSATFTLVTGIDGDVWSINGEHFANHNTFEQDGLVGLELETAELATKISVVEGASIVGKPPTAETVNHDGRTILRKYHFEMDEGEELTLQKVVAVVHDNEVQHPKKTAIATVQKGLKKGYDTLKQEHTKNWEAFWKKSDIDIEGNLEAQILVRFNLYQAFIATPTHANLPIGARGLSCQVYQGAAFWDQETFNLPMFTYTHPEIAKRLVAYRYDTLPGAKRKAKRLGYYGAFYAWTSGKTGDELFPDYFFTDVLTGRPIRNHFNCWQIHISQDVVYGIWLYYKATRDWDFIIEMGAEVLFEVAQFIVSRVHFKKDKNRYEIIRVLGPDEYHENVDNNAYTNYLTKYALEKACEVFEKLRDENARELERILKNVAIDQDSVKAWEEIASLLYLPEPDENTKVIEQFDGYFGLEDINPKQLRKRLIDPGEYWGWPNGIAVNTQVLKQADVIQLMAMLDGFTDNQLTANYDYYEPRTEHGSSLSPSVHALVACKAKHYEEAYRYFMESSTIDLYNASKKVMSGGSFLGGIHTAAAGGVWLIVVEGFAGFKMYKDGIRFRPALPEEWQSLSFKLHVLSCQIEVSVKTDCLTVHSLAANKKEIKIYFEDRIEMLKPSDSIQFI